MVPESPEKVSLTLRRASVAEVVPLITLARDFDTDDGAFDARQIAETGDRFVFDWRGMPVAGFVLATSAEEVFISAAGGFGKLDFTKIGLAAIEGMAAQFRSVAFATRRPGLIRKALRLGYEIEGAAPRGHRLRKILR